MLCDLDAQQELIAKNALAVLREHEMLCGLPRNEALKALAPQLHVSDFFATDAEGRFTRSTNGDPNRFKVRSLFEFCQKFRELMDARAAWSTRSTSTPTI